MGKPLFDTTFALLKRANLWSALQQFEDNAVDGCIRFGTGASHTKITSTNGFSWWQIVSSGQITLGKIANYWAITSGGALFAQNATGGAPGRGVINAEGYEQNGYVLGPVTCWVTFDATPTVSILDSENVTSITDNGPGDFTVNFTNTFASNSFSTQVTAGDGTLTGANAELYQQSTSATRVRTFNLSGTYTDYNYVAVTVVGGI
jgi:hypothetical protein